MFPTAPTLERRTRLGLLRTAIFVIAVFQEALDMRRAAQRRYFLGDE